MTYVATLHGTVVRIDLLLEGYRAIIEANYNYAVEKYGEGFDVAKVESYQCVRIARSALSSVGVRVEVEILNEHA